MSLFKALKCIDKDKHRQGIEEILNAFLYCNKELTIK